MHFTWRTCPECNKDKTTNSFLVPLRKHGPKQYREMCNVCFDTQYTPLHSGRTNNRTYLKYRLHINGCVCQERGFNVFHKQG